MIKLIHHPQISTQQHSMFCVMKGREVKKCQNTSYFCNKQIYQSSHSASSFTTKCQERTFGQKSLQPHNMMSLVWLTRLSHPVLNLSSAFVFHKTLINLSTAAQYGMSKKQKYIMTTGILNCYWYKHVCKVRSCWQSSAVTTKGWNAAGWAAANAFHYVLEVKRAYSSGKSARWIFHSRQWVFSASVFWYFDFPYLLKDINSHITRKTGAGLSLMHRLYFFSTRIGTTHKSMCWMGVSITFRKHFKRHL